jgi:uncharacterized tellurite resistance protein B-like protein
MLKKLKDLFSLEVEQETPEAKDKKLQQASAALLVEVLRADFEQTPEEIKELKASLQRSFSLTNEELDDLLAHSLENGEENISLHPFTALINEHYDYDKRVELISLMWKMAFADGHLDKYEDNIIRKVADLLYIRHSDFIKTKLAHSGS